MTPQAVADTIDDVLEAHRVPEAGGLIQTGTRPAVKRLGLALDWEAGSADWAHDNQLDAVWIHRLPRIPAPFPMDLSVICHHAAFDRRFGLAANVTLHAELGGGAYRQLSDRPALSIVRLDQPIDQTDLAEVLRRRFGGIERTYGYGTHLSILAMADGMQAELLQAASSAGAELYLTGQWRPTAEAAAEAAGLSILTIGHGPIERRGLRDMGDIIAAAQPGLEILVSA